MFSDVTLAARLRFQRHRAKFTQIKYSNNMDDPKSNETELEYSDRRPASPMICF